MTTGKIFVFPFNPGENKFWHLVKKKVSKSKIKIHWWTKINEPCHILQLSLLLWYTMLLTAVFCFIRSISTIRGTITTPSWWNAVRVVALKLIWTTEICWKSMQNKTFPVSNIITQYQVLFCSIDMVVAHSTITSLALNFLVIIHIGCKQGESPRNVFYIFRQQGYLLYKAILP